MTNKNPDTVFDYRALRLLVGLIAFALPWVVSILSTNPLSSISASYYGNGRNAFVGMLFIVSSFLWAYNGHTSSESWASKAASLAAILVAIIPTSCDFCETNIESSIHYGAATILFSILVYFCFGPFRENTKGLGGKKGRRSTVYLICGWIMVGCMLAAGISNFTLSSETIHAWRITYWAEAIALGAFGFAWIVAGKYFKPFVDKDEALHLFAK
jgi:hypothetical protein